MIKTTQKDFEYLGLKYTGVTTFFTRKSEEKVLSEAIMWMKEHSNTFMQFELQTGDFMTGSYVARHSGDYFGSESHYNGDCYISKTKSGKSWMAQLYLRKHRS